MTARMVGALHGDTRPDPVVPGGPSACATGDRTAARRSAADVSTTGAGAEVADMNRGSQHHGHREAAAMVADLFRTARDVRDEFREAETTSAQP